MWFKLTLRTLLLLLLWFVLTGPAIARAEVTEEQKIDLVRELIEDNYYKPVDDAVLEETTIEDMLSHLDEYSQYMKREEYENFITNISPEISGIGVQVKEVDKGMVITSVFEGSGADQKGLQAGDIIIEVGHEPVGEMSLEAAVNLMRGEEGTSVDLRIYRPQKDTYLSKTITRKKLKAPVASQKELGGNIGYIRAYSFSEDTSEQISRMINDLDSAEHFIFDLRNNSGGYLNAAREVAGFFPEVEGALRLDTRRLKNLIYAPVEQETQFKQPVSLLLNEYTASAGEIVAGAVQDYGAGKLYGQTTFGKGTVQSLYYLDPENEEDSDVLKLTTGEFFSPLGEKINKVGVTPEVNTEDGAELEEAHHDVLKKIYGGYHDLGSFPCAEGQEKIMINFSNPVDPDSLSLDTFSLVALGEEALDMDYRPVSDTKIELKLSRSLEAGEAYELYLHPQVKSASGEELKEGFHGSIEVQEHSGKRYGGANRFETAAEVALSEWEASDYAVLAYGNDFPDALAAGPLAGAMDAPILLTGTDNLHAATEKALEDLEVEKVIIAGGAKVISPEVTTYLKEEMDIEVERLAGEDRFETAVAISQYAYHELGLNFSGDGLLVNGLNFPDALSGTTLSEAISLSREEHDFTPIFLTCSQELSAKTADYLKGSANDLLEGSIYLIGGSAALADDVRGEVESMGFASHRLGGSHRFSTAAEVARYVVSDVMQMKERDSQAGIKYLVANGLNYPDALVGGALASRWNQNEGDPAANAPVITSLILTRKDNLPSAMESYLDEWQDYTVEDTDNYMYALGGEEAVDDAILRSVYAILSGEEKVSCGEQVKIPW